LAALSDEEPPSDTLEALGSVCERVSIVSLHRTARWMRAAASLVRGRSATEGLFFSRGLEHIVKQWTSQTRYDGVLAFCSSMLQYLTAFNLPIRPCVIDMMDVDSQKWFDYAERAPAPARTFFHLEGRRVRQLEREALRRANVAVVSRDEANLLLSMDPTAAVHAVPNGVDVDYFKPTPARGKFERGHQETTNRRACVFVGALDYRANVDGVTWFCREVWPVVRRRFADAQFIIVGRRPCRSIQRLSSEPGVTLVGDVPDVRPYLDQATVVVAPLRIARGIQNKVLEALAVGKPVVATPQAVTGLDVMADVHLLQAETVDQWASKLGLLFDDGSEFQRLGEAGRAFVCERHRWAHCLEPLDDILGLGAGLLVDEQHSRPCTPAAAAP
jgi:sugar transferase (PEP-CTERM/EpsH1 system associated)